MINCRDFQSGRYYVKVITYRYKFLGFALHDKSITDLHLRKGLEYEKYFYIQPYHTGNEDENFLLVRKLKRTWHKSRKDFDALCQQLLEEKGK